jgi:hypothetical protein
MAAQGGHLDVLKWLVEHGCPLPFWNVRYFATKFGHLDVLEWLDGVEANV